MARNYKTIKIQKNKKLRKQLFDEVSGICPDCNRAMVFESKGNRIPKPYSFDGDVTEYCYGSNSRVFSIDHIKPISKGGGDEVENLRGICLACNKRKKDK